METWRGLGDLPTPAPGSQHIRKELMLGLG